jgi:hypothetical protein
MKTSRTLLAISLAIATLLAACGGGSDALVINNNNSPGAVQGNIASIVGSYSVNVVAADCDPADSSPTTTIAQVGGACKITTTLPTGTVVETRRDILPPGSYTLKITSDGAMEMLQGSTSKVKINCPSGGICRVDDSVYTLVSASGTSAGAVSAVLSQVFFDLNTNPKKIVAASLYGIGGNATFTGTSPLLTNETGILVIDQPS